MVESEPEDEAFDLVVDKLLRGEDPNVEQLIADAPAMAAVTREKLRKIAGEFGPRSTTVPIANVRADAMPFEELGAYKLLSRMGEGGMGMVYLAEHRFLKRQVALKIIRPELAFSPATRQRFQREAMSVAKLRHENIVSVYDAGEHDGVAYLAMEVVEGCSLDELLESERRSGRTMSAIVAAKHARGIARALQCAHDAGIIHRDVKPANVRITPDGRELLLDFGLSLTEESAALSTAGFFRGTPQYASPEQIETSTADIDARTDIYSLGVLLYECLTGRPPFAAPNLQQLFHKILSLDAPAPRKLSDGVDAELDGIVMRAIAKRREERFATAGEMALALDRWIEKAERCAQLAQPAAPKLRTRAIALAVGAFALLALLPLLGRRWLVSERGSNAPSVVSDSARPVVFAEPRATTPLFGAGAFDQRLAGWDHTIGSFGADVEGAGVVGNSETGTTAAARELAPRIGRVRGSAQPLPRRLGERTLAVGAGIELSNGHTAALLLVSSARGYDVRAYEIVRDGREHWSRGAALSANASPWNDNRPCPFELSWNETDVQLAWGDAGAASDGGSVLVSRAMLGSARPIRFVLLVEQGVGRFDSAELEEF